MMNKVKTFLELIKFEHTMFALPFAYIGMVTARPAPLFKTIFWVTVAMVGARTSGMTLNRLIDRRIDAENPRTRGRALVTGEFSVKNAWIAVGVSLAALFFAAWMLNPLCLMLSPIAVALLATYHFAKRYTWLCHFSLGLVLGIAPMGGWIAATGKFSWVPVPLALAVMTWVAGFDILYALQDVAFDKAHELHSIPVKFGESDSLEISFYSHVATIVLLTLFGFAAGLGILYWIGVVLTAVLLKIEHSLVSEGDLSNLNAAFFTVNGWVGILLLVFTCLEVYR